MSELTQIDDFSQLFTGNTPLIDTRAPIEFKQGAFPHAQNLPLMSDDEREQVGTCYKQHGQQQAIALGYELVKDDVKAHRLQAWLTFIKNNPNGALYCFRGGIRSQIAQQWIFEASEVNYPRISGGYKALRLFLMNETNRIMPQMTPIVLGGQTGCGKTLLLNKITQKIDLEGLANHRGSAFGSQITSQPSQIDFENALAIMLIKQNEATFLVFEDEGKNIGTLSIPQSIQTATSSADLVVLTANLDERVQISLKAYVVDMLASFMTNSQTGFEDFSNYWLGSLSRIQKRLGGVRYKALHHLSQNALDLQQKTGDISGFHPIIESLLVDYYDPMYDYQINKKSHRIVFQGDADEVLNYIYETFASM